MKFKKILSTLAVLSFAIIGSFSVAPPANAAVVIVDILQNGVTCHQHTNAAYPEDGHFYDCTNLHKSYATTALGRFKAWVSAGSAYPQVGPTLTSAPKASLYVFDDPIDYKAFNTPGWGNTLAQRTAAWTAYQGVTGATILPSSPNPCVSNVWGYVPSNVAGAVYPAEIVQGTSVFQGSTAHELGHCFNSLAALPWPSTLSGMTNAMTKDKAYMQANDPNYATDYSGQNLYWLQSNEELFVEEFNYTEVNATTVITGLIRDYWKCSTFYTKWWMVHRASPAAADYTAGNLARCN